MKHIPYLFLAILVLSACSGDDEPPNTPPEIGAFVFEGQTLYNSDTVVVSIDIEDRENDDLQVSWTFSSGTFKSTDQTSVTWYTPDEPVSVNINIEVSDGQNSLSKNQEITLSQKPLEFWWTSFGKVPSEMNIRWRSSTFVNGDNIFIGTGRTLDNSTRTPEMWKLDMTTEVWARSTDYPGPSNQSSSLTNFTINDKGYTISGCCDYDWETFYEFDLTSETWTQLDDFPGVNSLASPNFVIDDKAYLVDANLATWQFDPTTKNWKQLSDFPGESNTFSIGFSSKSYGFVSEHKSPRLFKYDPSNDTWTEATPIPTNYSAGLSYVELNGLLITSLGFDPITLETSNETWIYSPENDQWTKGPNFPETPMTSLTTFSYKKKAYFLHGSPLTDKIWQLNKNQ